jgi:hypothetical protein
MSAIYEQRHQLPLRQTQTSLPQVFITGDLQLSVTESDADHGPVKGSYRIEIREMQEPLQVLWGAGGQVQSRRAKATDITFEMSGARAGQMRIYPVQVQVTDRRRCIVTGVFVQILVTPDTFLQETA